MRLLILLALFFLVNCTNTKKITYTTPSFPKGQQPKNVILMIGDGMGLSAVSAAMYMQNRPLHLEQFPVIGFHKTHSSKSLKTDSAAGATAFSCGIKTYNGAIGIYPDSTTCTTLIEKAEMSGLATGLVVSSTIVHATPASFFAHQPLRILYEPIAEDLLNSNIDFFIGGGKRYFDYRDSDDRNLITELRQRNYTVLSFLDDELGHFNIDYSKKFAYFTANNQPLPVTQGRTYMPYASRLAANFLDRYNTNKGFFLMIEGSQIDWAAHANQGDLLVSEVLDFDETIGEILEFAAMDKETLIIVTADHETGGLAVDKKRKQKKPRLQFTTNDHTCTMVPVYAYGPGAEQFIGIYDNTAINRKICELMGLEILPSASK